MTRCRQLCRRVSFVTVAGGLLFVYATLSATADERDSAKKPGPIILPDAAAQRVATGYRFTEGPAADDEGHIYFTDIPNSQILKFDTHNDKVTVAYKDTSQSNGLMFDHDGNLLACSHGQRVLKRYDRDGGVTVMADQYDKKKLNSPNDLDIDADGGIYFTDPRYGNRDNIEQKKPDGESLYGVYYRDKDGQLVRVIDDLLMPNGLILSLDGQTLYVADNGAGLIYAYDVNGDATLTNRRLFAKARADGMTIDERGNVYAACGTGIEVWSPSGEHLERIKVPEHPANVTFGGPDHRTLYITARESLYRVKMNVAGAPVKIRKK